MTQNEQILRHLKDFGTITTREAVLEYDIMRLASRIHDLKKAGYDIASDSIANKNRYGENRHYSRYRLGA